MWRGYELGDDSGLEKYGKLIWYAPEPDLCIWGWEAFRNEGEMWYFEFRRKDGRWT